MTTLPPLRASNNSTFRWTRDLSAFAAVYEIASCVIRMQARRSPYAPDPPIYEWNSTNLNGGIVTFDPVTNLAVFSAPESDMARMSGQTSFDCRLELPAGGIAPMFGGIIFWSAGVTRAGVDARNSSVAGVGDTVVVDGEPLIAPVPFPASLTASMASCQASASSAANSASDANASAQSAAQILQTIIDGGGDIGLFDAFGSTLGFINSTRTGPFTNAMTDAFGAQIGYSA